MAEYTNREHYIPLRKTDLIELLCRDKQMPRDQVDAFKQFCTITSAIFHFEYLENLERLKDMYAPFDADSTTPPLVDLAKNDRDAAQQRLFAEMTKLLEKANFKQLSEQDIQAAVEGGSSDWGINMYVDFKIYENLLVFVRGAGKSKRTKRHWLFVWKKEEKTVDTYERLALAVKLRPCDTLPENLDTQDVFFKLFKDIPQLDLEMVLPGTTLMMPFSQKFKLGGSLLGTFGYGLLKVGSDILSALGMAVKGAVTTAGSLLWGPVVLLGGYGYKQYAGYQATKQTYSKMLTESLYYQTLDNNSGVLTHVLDEAEEQECREAILAYYCLWRFAPAQGWTAKDLDDYVEMYLEGAANLKVDFEIGDALDKVERLGVVSKSGDRYHAVPLETALEKLDYRWDNYFQYNKS